MAALGFPEMMILLVVALLLISRAGRGGSIPSRLDRLERKVDQILHHLGIEPARHLPPGVAELLAEGRKIDAIKLYRARTGAGLAEAKAAVEGSPPPGVKPVGPDPDDV
jgi:hypothetical protein